MRHVIFICGSILFLHLTGASPNKGAAHDARAIARGIEAHYRSISVMKAVFLETYRQGKENTRVESGTVYFRHPGQMRWEYEAPEQKLFLVDGKYAWFYVPADHTASRAPIKKSEDWRTPFALLTGKVNLERLCARIDLVAGAGAGQVQKDRVTDPDDVLLRCLPRGAEKPKANGSDSRAAEDTGGLREILIEAKPANQIVRVVVREAGDVETEIRFGNWQENLPLPVTMFQFHPPPGVAVVDEQAIVGGKL